MPARAQLRAPSTGAVGASLLRHDAHAEHAEQEPMDLGTIRSRLVNGYYRHPSEVRAALCCLRCAVLPALAGTPGPLLCSM